MTVQEAKTNEEIRFCFRVIRELRPHLDLNSFLKSIRRMKAEGYRMIFLMDPNLRAVAGFRQMEMLATGKILYVDDLVTSEAHRSKGYGKTLLAWLVDEAKRLKCQYVELDSGVKRLNAHRFYRRNRMKKVAFHFSLPAMADKMWSAEP